MKDKFNGVSEALGAEGREVKTLSLADVRKMVARDLPTCISFLQAVLDPDIQEQVSVFLHGKYMNAKHKEELEAQLNIKV